MRIWTLLLAFALPAWAEPEVTETQHKDWVEVCISEDSQSRCEAIQVLSLNQEGESRPLLRSTVTRVQDNRFIEFALPLGMDLRSGLVLQIDEGDEINFGFTTCVPQGCAGVLPLTDELFGALKAGNSARLGFRAFGNEQVQVLEISLSGLTAATRQL